MKYNKVGVICAMESEAAGILAAMKDKKEETVGTLTFYSGTVGRHPAVLAVCGIGKVFAAMCTQTMILKYRPDCIINSGVAGSLSEELDILDFAVSTNLVEHDMDTSPLGDPVGMISGINLVYLPSDDLLRGDVLEIAEKEGIKTLCGTIASGDQFIATDARKEWIKSQFSPIACEMEGAAVAQVAHVNKVPFVVIRAISDSYSGQNEMDYAAFAPQAAKKSARLIVSLLEG